MALPADMPKLQEDAAALPVHRLGHLDEPDRAVEHHQGEVGGARPAQRLLQHLNRLIFGSTLRQ